ncbi:MAG: glycosyltransferase family 61 protein [Chloroflexota bacterium]
MRTRILRWLDERLSAPQRQFEWLGREDYAHHPSISVHSFGQAETIVHPTPQFKGELLDAYANHPQQRTFPAPFVLAIKNGQIWGHHALVTTADKRVILDSLHNHLPYMDWVSSGRVHYPKTVGGAWRQITHTAQYNSVFVLANLFGNAYYHWVLESLPRLWLYQQLGESIPLLVSQPLPNFAQVMLDALGIDNVQMWDATRGVANTLYMPMSLYGTGIPAPCILKQMRQQIMEAFAPLPTVNKPRVYISRAHARKRRVVNEADLEPLLNDYGFEMVHLETLSIPEQIALFAQAEVVIGAHGAGFANLIYSDIVTVLEFFEPSYINTCFYRLANGMGFPYGYLLAASDGVQMRVDVDALRAMLVQMEIR